MRQMPTDEVLISIDVEASGPSPSTGSLIAIGACLVQDPAVGFYVELRPLPGTAWSEDAERIHRLSRELLEANGVEAAEAMQRLTSWVGAVAGERQPVFVGFNATFDWMFVADYLHRFTGANPFGHSGLDIKAYYMGRHRLERWADTARLAVAARYGADDAHSHNALDDAREQAELLRRLMNDAD